MAAELSTAFNTLPSLPQLLSSYGPSVLNGLIIVSTVSGQSLINKLAFTLNLTYLFLCPCSYPLNEQLSAGFLFGPCAALFLLAVLINQKTWRLVHGCCYRTRSTQHPVSTSLLYWLQIVSQALIAPVAWLFVSLLDGSYYKCWMSSGYCVNVPKCELKHSICETCVCGLDKVSGDKLVSESQFFAWLLLVGTGIAATIVICCVRIFSKFTYSQANYVQLYRDVEEKIFDEFSKDHATSIAKQNSQRFFESKKLFKIDWDALSALPRVENPYVILSQQIGFKKTAPNIDPSGGYILSSLQKWNKERASNGEELVIEEAT